MFRVFTEMLAAKNVIRQTAYVQAILCLLLNTCNEDCDKKIRKRAYV